MTTIEKAKFLKFTFPTLEVAVVGKWIWLSGDTRPLADKLKAQGLRFSRAKSKWYYGGEGFKPKRARTIPYPSIVQKYGEAKVQRAGEVPAAVIAAAEPVAVAAKTSLLGSIFSRLRVI